MDVRVLTDTKMMSGCVRDWEYGIGICSGVNEDEMVKKGVCFLVQRKWKEKIRDYGCLDDRLTWVTIKVKTKRRYLWGCT